MKIRFETLDGTLLHITEADVEELVVRCVTPPPEPPPDTVPPEEPNIPPPEEPTFPPPEEPDPPDPEPPVDPPIEPGVPVENTLIELVRDSDELIAEVFRPPVPPGEEIPPDPPPDPEIPPEPPPETPPGEVEFHRTIQGPISFNADVVVPDGEKWTFKGHVKFVRAHLRTVGGQIHLRPGATLEFLGGIPSEYRGGGMTYGLGTEKDFGIWIGAEGYLDIRGTPKLGWNRTGVHSTWVATDEYWIAPTAQGDVSPRPWKPGDPIPQIDPRVPKAEVVNVTRDIIIKGTGHIHIHSHHPQRIEYCRIEGFGITQAGRDITGRYALHFHHGGEGARGTIVRGVAFVNSRGKAFVPHLTHGVTATDNVAVNSWTEAFWWDRADPTFDIMMDRFCALGGNQISADVWGGTPRFDLIHLTWGERMTMKNCVAAGCRANKLAVGFGWETGPGAPADGRSPVWIFNEGNVAHNNTGPGVRFWNNSREGHIVANYISYHNGIASIENGAYKNANRYLNVFSFKDGVGVLHHSSQHRSLIDNLGSKYENCHFIARNGPAFNFEEGRNLASELNVYLELRDCVFQPATGHTKFYLGSGNNKVFVQFIRCGVTPADIGIKDTTANRASEFLIDPDGTGFQQKVIFTGGVKQVINL